METLGAVSASIDLTKLVYKFIHAYKNAIEDRKRYLEEIEAVQATLEIFKQHLEEDGFKDAIPSKILACFDSIDSRIQSLAKKLEDPSEKTKRKRLWARTQWNIIQADVKDDIQSIYHKQYVLKYYLDEYYRNEEREERAQDRVRMIRIDGTLQQSHREQRQKEVLQWLSPLQPLQRQKFIYKGTYPATEWLMAMDEYVHWMAGNFDAYLWLYGDPGVGKTVLAAQLTEQLRNTNFANHILVLNLFIDYKETDTQTLPSLVGSLLKQLIQQRTSDLAPEVLEMLYLKSQYAAEPDTSELLKVLIQEFEQYTSVYLIVDGWNDLLEDVRKELTTTLRGLSQSAAHNVSVCITSRYAESETAQNIVVCVGCGKRDLKIHHYCQRCSNYKFCLDCAGRGFSCGHPGHVMKQTDRVEILVKPIDEEIRNYVEWEIKNGLTDEADRDLDKDVRAINLSATALDRALAEDDAVLERVKNGIVERSLGNYQLAKLYIDDIKSMPTPKHIDEALKQLPDGLPAAYQATMDRILNQKKKWQRELARFAFYWVTCAKRPLSLAELQQAYDIEIDSSCYVEDKLFYEAELIQISSGLINVEFDKSFVRVHLTLDEFLRDHKERYFTSQDDQNTARRLLTCLNYDIMETPCRDDAAIDERLASMPLLSYASQYWAQHMKPVETDSEVAKALIRFLSHSGKVASYMEINYRLSGTRVADFDVRRGVNGLHIAARFGLDSTISELTTRFGVDSADDKYGQTALMYAARHGHRTTVQQLLEHGASVNVKSNRGITALFECYAGMQKNKDLEQSQNYYQTFLLLAQNQEVDINARNEQELQQTILMLTSRNGDDRLVASLSTRNDVEVNLVDQEGNSALMHAVCSGSSPTVRHLLHFSSLDVNVANNCGRSPLSMAAALQCPSKVEIFVLLLKEGADPVAGDVEAGTTPLLGAIESGDLYIFGTLLGYSLDVTDTESRNLLHLVCSSPRASREMAQQVIDAGLPIDGETARGQTPLHCACRAGSYDIVRLLLDYGADSSKKDSAGRTAVDVARQNAFRVPHIRILHLLEPPAEGQPQGEPVQSHARELPFWCLPHVGLIDELDRRISAGTADLSDADPDTGNTAFHYSVIRNRLNFLERLTAVASDEQMSRVNDQGRTPLHLAAWFGNVRSAEMLLKATEVPLEAVDTNDHKAIWYALQNRRPEHYIVAVRMLAKGAEMDTSYVTYLQRTFDMAVRLREAAVADYLISKGADHLHIDEHGLTARMVAKDNNDVEMLRVLDRNKSTFISIRPCSSDSQVNLSTASDQITDSGSTEESQEEQVEGPDLAKPAFQPRPRVVELAGVV